MITLITFLWRYFTGHHLDGEKRTNATWFKTGTEPAHHVNWWTRKPRVHRMMWRWGMFFVPIGLFSAYQVAPFYRVNLVALVMLPFLPYLFHNGTVQFLSLIPKHKVVIVQDTVMMEHVNAEIDHIIREPLGDDDGISELTEMELPIEIENERSKRRRS